MDNNLNIFKDFILDLLFPKYCIGCGEEGQWICKLCQRKIVLIKNPTCPKCQRISKMGRFCERCRDQSQLKGLVTAAYYEDGPLKEAIHTFKYEGVADLKKELAKILIKSLVSHNFDNDMVVIPVPLHKKRKTQRGYNQSELLVKEILAHFDWQFCNDLKRTKYTKKTQVELSGKDRRKNILNCFDWIGETDQLISKKVILVDDIYTTGATLEECAKILRQKSGVKEVWGLVLAKA